MHTFSIRAIYYTFQLASYILYRHDKGTQNETISLNIPIKAFSETHTKISKFTGFSIRIN